jgi:hypothetical protein
VTTPKRRPGRPALDAHDPSVEVSVRLPSRQYDRLYEQAQRERIPSVPALIRRLLRARDCRRER